ncbi:hypothetical protein [Haloactinomyces albus]|uniref:Peptidoglycan/LPS O-acetylase OafA/YrhL n=1 Tax=Haloactinomyces albus TaxID=1352928 RepID=A0AAE4CP93_9ACTN|nr:hypothetical protein [Haloactinomyces albus]MDR7301468.1 peptidoglycan/LPS O-acetylase OafA/YrhL [Haloactinomyces albus]
MSRLAEQLRQARNAARHRERRRRQLMGRALPNWRVRSRRRVLALLWLFGPLSLITMTLALEWGNPVLPWIYTPILVSWFPLGMILRVLTAASIDSSDSVLDERERQVRDSLTRVAFTVLLVCNFLLVVYLGQPDPGPLLVSKATVLLICSILLSTSVPTALLAWRMPDDDPEDFDETVPGAPTTGANGEGERNA